MTSGELAAGAGLHTCHQSPMPHILRPGFCPPGFVFCPPGFVFHPIVFVHISSPQICVSSPLISSEMDLSKATWSTCSFECSKLLLSLVNQSLRFAKQGWFQSAASPNQWLQPIMDGLLNITIHMVERCWFIKHHHRKQSTPLQIWLLCRNSLVTVKSWRWDNDIIIVFFHSFHSTAYQLDRVRPAKHLKGIECK